jgi:hypothetical protein
VLPLAPVMSGPTSCVRVGTIVRPSFFLSAPAMAPRMVCCCQPVAAAICSTVAPSGRFSSRDSRQGVQVHPTRRFGDRTSVYELDRVTQLIGGHVI